MKMLINGRPADADRRQGHSTCINPANGQTIDHAPLGRQRTMSGAPSMRQRKLPANGLRDGPGTRQAVVQGRANRPSRVNDLATTLTIEQGKPFKEARDEIQGFANILEFYAGISASLRSGLVPVGNERYGVTMRRPIGICGAIIPWNVPGIIMGWKVGRRWSPAIRWS